MASALAAATGACLIPPPIDEEDPAENQRPTVSPFLPTSDGEPYTLQCSGSGDVFVANLNDPDTNDTLYWRVLIDAFRADTEELLATTIQSVASNRGAVRPISFSVSAQDATLQERPTDVHIVELVVVDREFDPDPDNTDPRAPISPGLETSYSWTINPIDCP